MDVDRDAVIMADMGIKRGADRDRECIDFGLVVVGGVRVGLGPRSDEGRYLSGLVKAMRKHST